MTQSFSRRNFFRIAGTGVLGYYFADVLEPRLLLASATSANATLRNTAKNCIFIFLAGAPSQTDMWDMKEGAWTPSELAPTPYGELRWPQGLLPKMGEHLGRMTIARSCLAWAAVHELGQAWAQIARNPGGATGAIAPHIGAVVALESQATRTVADVLPGFIALNSGSIPTCGYLPAKYAPFGVTTASTGLATLSHPDGAARFSRRWDLLHQLDTNRATGALGKAAADMNDFYDQSKTLIDAPGINTHFSFTEEEHTRYGASNFGDSLIVARNLVAAGQGTRFVQATMGGWDHHSDIYDKAADQSLFAQCAELDAAVGSLMTDLTNMKILDQTLIVIVSEFGRTVGPLNNQGGRDHYLRNSAVFAGGGTKGGRTLGQTDAEGKNVINYGWSANRDIRPEDVTSTIYSALGIDYTKVRTDDPLGRGFEYIPAGYAPIEELWGA
jgi:hypothetical protein